MFLTAPQSNSGAASYAGVSGTAEFLRTKPGLAPNRNEMPQPGATRPVLEDRAVLELYDWLNRRRSRLFGSLRQCDRQDAVEETFAQTLAFAPKLRNPDALRSACLTIGLRIRAKQIWIYSHESAGERSVEPVVSWSPERHLHERLRHKRAYTAISRLRTREREILQRFYFSGQSAEKICAELHITQNQFRLQKSRALKKAGSRAQRLDQAGMRLQSESCRENYPAPTSASRKLSTSVISATCLDTGRPAECPASVS